MKEILKKRTKLIRKIIGYIIASLPVLTLLYGFVIYAGWDMLFSIIKSLLIGFIFGVISILIMIAGIKIANK